MAIFRPAPENASLPDADSIAHGRPLLLDWRSRSSMPRGYGCASPHAVAGLSEPDPAMAVMLAAEAPECFIIEKK
jgi:hypothetical protein